MSCPTASSSRSACARACEASRQLTAAGTYTITCRVNRATRRALRTRPIPIRVRVTYVGASGSAATQTMTVLLRRTKK